MTKLGAFQSTPTLAQIYYNSYPTAEDSGAAMELIEGWKRCGHPLSGVQLNVFAGLTTGMIRYGEATFFLFAAKNQSSKLEPAH
jgi:hypothetical protein